MENCLNNIINYFWIGSKISAIEKLSFISCLKNNMTPVLWCYEKIEDVPHGVIINDANHIIPIEKIRYYLNELRLPIPSVSDIFRYELLIKNGGIYADTDIIFKSDLKNLNYDEYFCSTYEYIYGQCASNCFMKLQKNSAVAKFLITEVYQRLDTIIESGNNNFNYCELGPFVIQKCASLYDIKILNYDVINPISWRWVDKIIAYNNINYKFYAKQLIRKLLSFLYENKGYFITKNTVAIHLCNEVWKANGIDKNNQLHKFSLFERLKKNINDR